MSSLIFSKALESGCRTLLALFARGWGFWVGGAILEDLYHGIVSPNSDTNCPWLSGRAKPRRGLARLIGRRSARLLMGSVPSDRILFHDDIHPHPGMNAALEVMHSLRQSHDLNRAALQKARPGYRNAPKTSSAFRYRRLATVERWNEASAESRDFRKRVRLSALVGDADHGSFLDMQGVWLEIPVGVGSSSRSLGKKVG